MEIGIICSFCMHPYEILQSKGVCEYIYVRSFCHCYAQEIAIFLNSLICFLSTLNLIASSVVCTYLSLQSRIYKARSTNRKTFSGYCLWIIVHSMRPHGHKCQGLCPDDIDVVIVWSHFHHSPSWFHTNNFQQNHWMSQALSF